MAQTRIGAAKARDKNLARDPDFYKKIGKIGGKRGHTGGFYANRELARIAGKKGGAASRKRRKVVQETFSAEDVQFPLIPVKQSGLTRFLSIFKKARS